MPNSYPLRAHGSTSVSAEGQLLVTDLHGPFNQACYDDWARAALPLLHGASQRGPTASLVRFHGSALTQPEVLERMQAATRTAVAQLGLRAVAFAVAPEVEGSFMVQRLYTPLHEGLIPFQVFDDETAARQWLHGHLRP